MEFFRAAVLGIVQGLTEFLPVSSSGHLILVPRLFNWDDQGLAFDVGLHLGTLVALLIYFWRDWVRMAFAASDGLRRHGLHVGAHPPEAKLLWLIAVGSVPAAIIGLLFADWIESHVREPWLVVIGLAVMGLVMLVIDRRSRRTRDMGDLNLRDAIVIGCAQAIALIPGVSRSGATISAGLVRDLDRAAAARFAFLLGTPAFVGAAVLKAGDFSSESGSEFAQLTIGFACSAIVGILVIHYLLRWLRTRTLVPFVVYRIGVAVLTLAIGAIRIS